MTGDTVQQRGDGEVRFTEQMAELAPMLDQPAERAGLYISAEHLQLLEKLDHLTRYGQYAQVVFGPKGSGKTTLLEQLQSFAGPSLSICRIDAQPEMSLDALQQRLLACMQQDPAVVAQFDTDLESTSSESGTARLDAYAKAIAGASRQLRLLIDDAQQLQDAALDWLLNQWLPANPDDRQLVLFATPLLVERLNASRLFTEAIANRCHFTSIPAFDRDAIKGYVQYNFPDYAPLFGEDHWQFIEHHSFGLPGRIAEVVKRLEQLESSGRWPLDEQKGSAGKSSFKRYGFIGGLGVLVLVAVAAFSFLDLSPKLETERVSIRLPVPETKAPETSAPETQALEATTPETSASGPSLPAADPEVAERAANDTEPTSPWRTMADTNEAAGSVQAAEQGALEQGSAEEEQPVAAENAEVAAATVKEQQAGAQQSTAVAQVAPEAGAAQASATENTDETPPATEQLADNVAESASDTGKSAPEVAATEDRDTQAASAKASKKLVLKLPEPSTTSPADAGATRGQSSASAVPGATPQNSLTTISSPYLREQELLNWASSGYTLQLLGARKERSVVEFIRNRPDKDKLYYFATLYKDKPWYVVVYGNYPDRDTALAAIAHLPVDLKKRKPWARSVKGVQDDIRRQ